MAKIVSNGKTWTIIICLYAVSLIISIIYLFYFVDSRIISYKILILCIIYFSLFIFLNIIVMFDLTFNNVKGYEKLFNIITNFYLIFNLFTKILGLGIFTLMINYLESGYFKLWKKLADIIFIYYYKVKKMKKWKLILIAIAAIVALPTLLAIFIIYKDYLGLDSPIQFICIFFDIYAVFKIYLDVGFFVVQSIIDYKRQKNPQYANRYYIYSIEKIINETEKCINKIKTAHTELNKAIQAFPKTNLSDYQSYLQENFKEIEENLKLYEFQGNNQIYIHNNNNNNNNFNDILTVNNYNDNIDNTKNNNYNIIKTNNNFITSTDHNDPSEEIKNIKLQTKSKSNGKNSNNKSEDKIEKTQEKETKKEKEEEEDISKHIKKFKKSVRKINKMKKIYKDIEEEQKEDLIQPKGKLFYIKYIILFLAFAMVIITDILVPIVCYKNDDKYKITEQKHDEDEKEEGTITLVVGLFLMIPVYFLVSTYTVIVVFSTTRRRYITGDFLSGKQVNDNLSLIKTVKLICGYSFSLIYCNLYFWKALDIDGNYGKPQFYEKTIIPDYYLNCGVSVYMLLKIILIFVSSILFLTDKIKISLFKNDLYLFNTVYMSDKFDDNKKYEDFNRFIKEKNLINKFLKS